MKRPSPPTVCFGHDDLTIMVVMPAGAYSAFAAGGIASAE